MYNFNKAPVAYFAPATAPFRITVPAVVSPTCLSCRQACEHGSTICGRCLDVLSGDAELQLPPQPRRCLDVNDHGPLTFSGDDHALEPDTDEVAVARPLPASPEQDDQFDLRDEGDAAASLCATCTDATTHRCPCGALVCADCCDDAGRCPRCEV